MKRELYVIITAGGAGLRMGGHIAKQFMELDGEPILLRTIEMFRKWKEDVNLILVLPSEYKAYWKQYCLDHDLWFRHTIVSGGITRFHSVRNALKYVPDEALVAVHDGVRPFVPIELLNRLTEAEQWLDEKEKICGMIPVMPSVESMREKVLDEQGRILATVTVDRERYLFVQTPQVFDSTILKAGYRKAYSPAFTDDASVVESYGYRVKTLPGSRFNIKITTPEDLLMAEIILKMNS